MVTEVLSDLFFFLKVWKCEGGGRRRRRKGEWGQNTHKQPTLTPTHSHSHSHTSTRKYNQSTNFSLLQTISTVTFSTSQEGETISTAHGRSTGTLYRRVEADDFKNPSAYGHSSSSNSRGSQQRYKQNCCCCYSYWVNNHHTRRRKLISTRTRLYLAIAFGCVRMRAHPHPPSVHYLRCLGGPGLRRGNGALPDPSDHASGLLGGRPEGWFAW